MEYIKNDEKYPEIICPWFLYIIVAIVTIIFISLIINDYSMLGCFQVSTIFLLFFYLMIILSIISSDQFYHIELYKDKIIYKKFFKVLHEMHYNNIHNINLQYTTESYVKRTGMHHYNTCFLELISTYEDINYYNRNKTLIDYLFSPWLSTSMFSNNMWRLNLYSFTQKQKFTIFKIIILNSSNACVNDDLKQFVQGDTSKYNEWMHSTLYSIIIIIAIVLIIIFVIYLRWKLSLGLRDDY